MPADVVRYVGFASIELVGHVAAFRRVLGFAVVQSRGEFALYFSRAAVCNERASAIDCEDVFIHGSRYLHRELDRKHVKLMFEIFMRSIFGYDHFERKRLFGHFAFRRKRQSTTACVILPIEQIGDKPGRTALFAQQHLVRRAAARSARILLLQETVEHP